MGTDWTHYEDNPMLAAYGENRLACCGGLEDLTGNGHHLHRDCCEVMAAIRPALDEARKAQLPAE